MFNRIFVTAAAAIAVLSSLSAADCSALNATSPIVVHNQNDIDTNFKNCTIIAASIAIQGSYDGIFNISGVTNVTEIITVGLHTDGITQLVMDDLTFVGHLQLQGMNQIKSISLPKLSIANDILIQAVDPTSISFPMLTNSGTLNLQGNITSMDFSSLGFSQITTSNVPGNISFPGLKWANSLTLRGSFSSVSMPLLENVTGSTMIQPSNPSNISFPALKSAADVYITEINNLSVPLLSSAKSIVMEAGANKSDNFVFNLTSLVDVDTISLNGNVSDVLLPSLERVNTSMIINSSIPLNCTSAKGAFDHTVSLNGNETQGPDDKPIGKVFQCGGIPAPPPKRINKLAYGLGFTFGLGGGIAVILGIAFFWRARNENREAKALGITKKQMLAQRAAARKGKGSGGEHDTEKAVSSEHSG